MASRPPTPDPLRRWQAPAAVLVSGGSFFLGTGLAPIAALAWVAPLPIFLLAARLRARDAAAAAFAAALLGTANMWSYYLTATPIPIPVQIAAVIVLGTSGLFAATTLLLRGLVRRGWATLAVLAVPAAWAGGLHLASLAAGGMDLSSPTTQQTDLLPVLQVASLTGIYGVSYLVFLPAAAIAAVCSSATARRARARAAATGLVVLLAALGFGFVRLAELDSSGAPTTTVAALGRTPPAAQQGQWEIDPTTPAGRELLDSYVSAIRALPPDVDVVVLPEGVFAATGPLRDALLAPLAETARTRGIDVVVGAVERDHASGRWANSAFVVRADGGPTQQYVKHHDTGPRIEAGTALTIVDRAGVAICMDLNFPDPARAYAAAGARRLLLPASDTDVDGPWHARVAVARGVENGLAVAWGANRGTSVIADAAGHVLASADTAAPNRPPFAIAVAALPDGPGSTFYARSGDWFPWSCAALATLAVLALAVPRGRSTGVGAAREPARAGTTRSAGGTG